LKKQELAMKRESMALDDWSTRQWIALKRAALNGTTNWTTPLSTLTLQESMNVLSKFSSSYANNSYGWQCGTFVKRYLSQIGVNLPNVSSIDSKMSLIDPKITDANDGDVVIMTSSKYPNNWHMAIVESVDDDGTLHLLESNWNNDELVHRRTVNPWDKSILGYYRPTGWNGTGSSSYEWKNVSGGIFTRNDGLSFDLSGSSLFNSLSDTDKKTVIWLLNLQTDPNSLTTRMWYDKGQAQKLINAAQDINPAWKQDDFSNWQKVRQRWEKGKQWGWISRNWTAMKAAKELYEMVDEIDKFPSMTLNWLKNAAATEFWDPKIVKFKTTLEWFVTEAAGALKWWNAANATQDVARMDEILNQKMTKNQLKTSIRQLVDLLYGKNESEAMSVWEATYIKPNTPRIKEVADWMYNDLWIRGQELYYNYTPDGWWNVFNNASPSAAQSQYSVQDILSL
jgi:surface antigen